jgi:anti-anti-sigma regulatory factor
MVAVGADAQITDLTVNDHACLTFGEAEELFDLTAAFVRDGLSDGLKVLWLSDLAPSQAMGELSRRGISAEPAAAAGQMVVTRSQDSLLPGLAFAADHAMRWLTAQMSSCQGDGYPGLRIALDMSWALQPVAGVEQLPDFEEGIAAALAATRVSVLCQYDRDRFDPVTLASVSAFHSRLVTAATYHNDAVLRICRQYAPAGIRLAGEIDQSAEESLALALAEAIRVDGDITVNMAGLSFIDARCTRMIIDAARSLPPARKVVLCCSPAITPRFVLLGAADVPCISLVTSHDR